MSEVFPRRNLSDEAEPWGREMESRVVTLEGIAAAAKSKVAGQNRTTASTLGDLTRQLDRLDALYRAIPKPAQTIGDNSGFGLSGGWQTIAVANVNVPYGTSHAEVFAMGSAFLTNTTGSLVGGSMRLVANGNASPAQPYATFSDVAGFHASITPGFSWRFPVAQGATVAIALQVNPLDAATWGAHASNYATVAGMVTFTG